MIRNQWYVVLESGQVRNNPVGVTRLGEKLVFWRDQQGTVHCLRDRCAHRGAALSKGKVIRDTLECPFHGFQYDASGKCVVIPANGRKASVPERFRVQGYPVYEEHGFIWIWWGELREDMPHPRFFEDIDDSFIYASIHDPWDAHYSRVIENQLDVLHLPFVHHNTIGRGGRTLVDGPGVLWVDEDLLYVFPQADPFVGFLQDYLDKKQRDRLRYNMEWIALTPGDTVEIETARRSTRALAFPANHTRGWQSLGYRLEERRQRLKAEFAGLETHEVRDLVRARGRESVVDVVWHPLVVYTGDARPPEDIETFHQADLLLVDATFRNSEEAAGSRHGHIDASIALGMQAQVKHLVLMHLSERYTLRDIRKAIRAAGNTYGYPPRIGFFFEGRYCEMERKEE